MPLDPMMRKASAPQKPVQAWMRFSQTRNAPRLSAAGTNSNAPGGPFFLTLVSPIGGGLVCASMSDLGPASHQVVEYGRQPQHGFVLVAQLGAGLHDRLVELVEQSARAIVLHHRLHPEERRPAAATRD